MEITELYIKNFGMLTEKRIHLSEGLQVIYGENESGKSTLHGFIRAMLFGMERGRGKAAAKDDFSRYEPWENPGNYAGILWFRCGGKRFRLERNFGRHMKRSLLICEDDGEELSVENGDLEMLLGGITPALYDSTVSVGQLAVVPGQELSAALENYAANVCETGGGDFDVSGALKSLRDSQKETAKLLRKEEEIREEKRQRMLRECTYLEQDADALTEELEEKEKELAGLNVSEELTEGEKEMYPKEKQRGSESSERAVRKRKLAICGAAGICMGVGGAVWAAILNSWKYYMAAEVFGIVSGFLLLAGAGLLLGGGYLYLNRRRMGSPDEELVRQGTDRKHRAGNAEINRIRWEQDRIRAEIKEKQIRSSNLKEQCQEIAAGEEEQRLSRRLQALRTAEEQLRQTAEELGRQTVIRLNESVSHIFSEVTEGRYRGVKIGEKLQVTVWDGTRNIPADRLSRGTVEQIYFSMRMAAAEILQEEPLPVILDETFVFYDDKRLKSALKWLSGQKRQVIILSCSKREEQMIEQL